jgi:hypothetical protein
MDWREMAGRPTVRMADFWTNYRWAWSGGKKVGYGYDQIQSWNGQIDPVRGWVIAVCWIAACSAEYVHPVMSFVPGLTSVRSIYYLYLIVRRPRLILDFALTLIFNHLVLTTYYSASIPTSLFFYLVLIAGATLTIIVAEQLCVRREMREGLKVDTVRPDEEEGLVGDMELGNLRRD